MNVITIVLNFLGLILFLQWLFSLVKAKRNSSPENPFYTWNRFRNVVFLTSIIGLPLLVVNVLLPGILQSPILDIQSNHTILLWISIMLSLLIAAIWFRYIQSIDIYEPERLWPLFFTFIVSCICTETIVTFLYEWASVNGFMLSQSNTPLDNFIYCVVVIGGVEEFSKMIPVLLVLVFFPKAINEPYDFILYASVSALGFAFIENVYYIYDSGLYNIGGRALYAIVAHMTFSSTIFYGWMLCRFGFTRLSLFLVVPFFFLIAIFAHGFYDFWLFNFFSVDYSAITTLFFLITIHLWFTMKNNSVNVSNFFSPNIRINNDRIKSYLILSLTGLLVFGYLIVVLIDGRARANQYLFYELFAYGYLIFYLAFGLSQYKIIQDTLHPLTIPFDFFVPKPRNYKKNTNV